MILVNMAASSAPPLQRRAEAPLIGAADRASINQTKMGQRGIYSFRMVLNDSPDSGGGLIDAGQGPKHSESPVCRYIQSESDNVIMSIRGGMRSYRYGLLVCEKFKLGRRPWEARPWILLGFQAFEWSRVFHIARQMRESY